MAASPDSRSGPAERAVSPTVGVVLLVAIAVVLAATVAGMLTSLGGELEGPGPQIQITLDRHLDGDGNSGVPYVKLRHERGEIADGSQVVVKDGDGNTEEWEDIWKGDPTLTTPDYVHVDGKGSDCELNEVREGTVYRVIWRNGEGETRIIDEIEITQEPANPPAEYDC